MVSLRYIGTIGRDFQTSAAQLSAETTVCSGGRNASYNFVLLDKTAFTRCRKFDCKSKIYWFHTKPWC